MIRNVRLVITLIAFFLFSCATSSIVTLPASTRVLGTAIKYTSAIGTQLEVIHDYRTNVAIIKLPDGSVTILPLEHIGIEGRYGNNRMTLWEHDNGVVLWIDGNLTFSGKID